MLFVLLPCVLGGVAADRGMRLLYTGESQTTAFDLAQDVRRIIAEAQPGPGVLRRFEEDGMEAENEVRDSGLERVFPASHSEGVLPTGFYEFLTTSQPVPPFTETAWKKVFGVRFDPVVFRRYPGKPVEVRWGRVSAWLVWRPVSKGSCRLALYRVRSQAKLLERALEQRLLEGASFGAAGVIDRKGRRWWGKIGLPLDRIRDIWKRRTSDNRQDEGWEIRDGHVCHLERMQGGLLLYLDRDLSPLSKAVCDGSLWKWFFGILATGSILFFLVQNSVYGAPLAIRLWGLFSYVIFVPLLGVGVLVLGIHEDREGIRQRELVQQARNELSKFDDGFREEERRMARMFLRLSRHPSLDSGDKEAFSRAVQPLLNSGMIDRIDTTDWKNQTWFKRNVGISDLGLERISALLSEFSITEKIARDVGIESPKKSPVLLMTQDVLEFPLFGFFSLMRKPGSVQLFQSGQSTFYSFWLGARQAKRPVAYLNISRSFIGAVEDYLKRTIVQNRTVRLLAHVRSSGLFYGIGQRDPVLRALVGALSRSNEDQLGITRLREKEFLAVGIPGDRLTGVDLVALVSLDKSREEAALFRERVGWCVGLSLLIGFLCAQLLSQNLLTPIGQLTEGIAALRRRNKEYRIPIGDRDELGKMALAFNTMLENLVEIDLAREVHETLIAGHSEPPKGYEVALKVIMSAHLGGDYADSILLPDGRYIFLIGNVPLQGVGGALTVAMAKAAVAMQVAEQTDEHVAGKDEKDFLVGLNRTLYEIARPEQLNCMVGTIDPAHHSLHVVAADHPFPFLWRAASHTLAEIGNPGWALGVKPDLDVCPVNLDLAEGDTLLFFSSGVLRAKSPNGLEFGREQLRELFSAGVGNSPEKIVRQVEAALKAHLSGNLPVDDMTVLALRRMPGEKD